MKSQTHRSESTGGTERLYTRPFFLLFGAMLVYMSGYSLQVHFPQYVIRIGGDVGTVGWIFGLGMVGSIAARPFVGQWIDRVGCKRILLIAIAGGALAIFCFQWFDELPVVCLLRVALQLSLAAYLTTVAVWASQIAPPGRSAECLAMIGVGGLAGMVIGPAIGDFIFTGHEHEAWAYRLFFNLGAGLMLLTLGVVALMPSGKRTPFASPDPAVNPGPSAEHRHQPFFRLAVAHWPGAIVVVAFCFAGVQTIPLSFMERLVEDRGFGNVKFFFLAYSSAAIVSRLLSRRAPQRFGRRRLLIFGMVCYGIGLLLLTGVRAEADLLVPALVMGVGHCFSYPFLVDLAAETMPPQHRGVATALILSVVDMGFLFGGIVCGTMIERFGFNATLTTLSCVSFAGVAYYAWTQRRTLFVRQPSGAS